MRYNVEGYNLDDLIRKLARKGIKIHDLDILNDKTITFWASDNEDKRIKRLIRNYQTSTSGPIITRIMDCIVSNLGLMIGIVVGIITYIISSHYIWHIKIIGNSSLDTAEIISVLNTNGVKVGGTSRIDSSYIEEILLNRYDMIAQASAITRGTSVIINISEKLVYNDTHYAPIVAKHSGVITSIALTTGTLNVEVGDYVNEGDILVYPYNLDSVGREIPVVPNARIEADMFITGVADIGRTSIVLEDTGQTITTYKYKLRDFTLFSGKAENSFDIFSLEVYNEYISDILPISRDVYVYHEQHEVEVSNDFSLVVDDLIQTSEQVAEASIPDGDILDRTQHTEIIGDRLYAYTNITIHGEISASNQRTN